MGINTHPGGFPQRKVEQAPAVDAATMREIERIALEEFGLDVLQIMENAGRATANLALAMLGGTGKSRRVIVLAGPGHLGGAGLVALRHLANAGVAGEPFMAFVEEDELPPATRRQVHILRQAGIVEPRGEEPSEVTLTERLEHADLVIDALTGYGSKGPLPGLSAALIEMVGESKKPVLALEGPSGLNCTTGDRWDPSFPAAVTLSFELPKTAMVDKRFRDRFGEVYVADMGIPSRVHSLVGVNLNGLFSEGPIVRIRR